MKVQCGRDTFLGCIQMVQNIVSTKTTLPILSNVLIEAEKDSIALTTTDLEVGIKCRFPAKVSQEGHTTLPAKRLSNIMRELPSQQVSLDATDNNITSIKCGASFFKIMGMGKDEFPKLPHFADTASFKIDQKVFKDIIKKTAFAISHDETRYVLNGISLVVKDGKILAVATDGRRLALIEKEQEIPSSVKVSAIIPAKAILELSRILKDEGSMRISFAANQVAFDMDESMLVSRLIEGAFPNYQQVIPSKINERVSVAREEFLSAVKRVSVLVSERLNSVKMCFAKDILTISINTPDVGEAREEVPIKYDGKELTVAFNPVYLLDVLKALDDESVFVELIDSASPGIIKTDENYVYVIMPMRLT
ncbi:MAG: DNA polymerase III subunit beta [Candidatus Ancaeobacter aquaticus]|nr:DNA polymerase III subunit beta [Candidatus Ancaeobacter aquaticus]